jgi:hypothetical protein
MLHALLPYVLKAGLKVQKLFSFADVKAIQVILFEMPGINLPVIRPEANMHGRHELRISRQRKSAFPLEPGKIF